MSRFDDPELVEREYVALDRLASRRLDRSAWMRGLDDVFVLLGAIAEARPRRVLDAGCGSGDWASLLAAAEVVCVDQSDAAVEVARRRGLDARKARLQELPFPDGSFDVVMCNYVLYHVRELDRALSELARVLRLGGRFVGAYTLPEHLGELWAAVRRDPSAGEGADAFDGHNGAEYLAHHFVSVERRDTTGEVSWETRETLQTYLDGYRELLGPLEAPAGPYPFRATRRNCVFVAVKAAVET